MALDLWFRDDVTRILASLADEQALRALAEHEPNIAVYMKGYDDALAKVAKAFGVGTPEISQKSGSKIAREF